MSFSTVDAAPEGEAANFVIALDGIAAMPAVRRLRAAAVEMLAPTLGDRLVDVGCGTGDEVRTLAAMVGPQGSVVGVDPSTVMLDEARRRTGPVPTIDYRQDDAMHLELEDASFDGTRSERVFQHLDDPEAAIAELARITRPGGRVVVVDTDWGMHVIQGADPRVTARVVEAWADQFANGPSGRQLPGLFAGVGITDVAVVAETFTSIDPLRPTLPPFALMASAAVRAGSITEEESAGWLAELSEAGRQHRFFWAATMFAVAGRRP